MVGAVALGAGVGLSTLSSTSAPVRSTSAVAATSAPGPGRGAGTRTGLPLPPAPGSGSSGVSSIPLNAYSSSACDAATAKVLKVGLPGTLVNGVAPDYGSIQAAVDAADPCDWILVAPGDYKELTGASPAGDPNTEPSGVLVTTPDIHIRGLDRNGVVVDGTMPGTPRCSALPADQAPGPGGAGLNGIMVWKADDVAIENLTVCNYEHGSGNTGNEIWWNGGDDSAKIGGWGYYGGYLAATETSYTNETTAAQYGIFSSNWSGGTWDQTYASNFNDSGYYIGACQDVCNQWVDHAWAEDNALGYSGSNSGGVLVVQNSQFDDNKDGFDTNSQNGDDPPPQDGACPPGVSPPVVGAQTCWVFTHNYVHDNNNPNVPLAGTAGAGPVGTGMSVSGARDDTILENTFADNGAWGVIFVPYPDGGATCTGGTELPGAGCYFDEYGDALLANTFEHNGFFGNPTNGDFGATNLLPNPPDCFHGNSDTSGHLTSSPPLAQLLFPSCTGATEPPDANAPFTAEVACDVQSLSIGPVPASTFCLPTDQYPRQTSVVMAPLPPLATMADPCAGVPANPWCPYGDVVQPQGAVTIGAGGYPTASAPASSGAGGSRWGLAVRRVARFET
jgi:hypothetical protein